MNKLTVVMYHYVRDLKNSRYPSIKGLELDLFEEQILFLKKNYNVVRMEEVIDCMQNSKRLPSKAVLLTFDDAYSDHYQNVFPLLVNHGLQGSFFAPVLAITEHQVLDVNKIHFILASNIDVNFIIQDLKEMLARYFEEYSLHPFDYYFNKLAVADEFDTKEIIFIKRLLQVELIEPLRNKLVDELFVKYVSVSEKVFSRELYMSLEQLKHMVKAGMHVGSHGYNHYWWSRLDNDQLKNEIEKSFDFIKRLGGDMNYFTTCYPYGSYNENVMSVLGKYGCKLAFTTEVAVADLTQNKALAIPRLDTNHLPKIRSATPNNWFSLA